MHDPSHENAKEKPMRFDKLPAVALIMAGGLAMSTLAFAQTGTGAGSAVSPGASSSAPGTSSTTNPGATDSMQGQRTGPSGRTGTTGQDIGGTVGGNAQRPGGTNNDETGTQSHDAQKGGSGKDGAR